MSAKSSKKIRQLYRRNVRKSAEITANLIGNALKPKPKYCPMWLWVKGLSIFIKVNKDQ